MDIRKSEISWYIENGKYPDERITKDADDRDYVIGDESWNAKNPAREESVEVYMSINGRR